MMLKLMLTCLYFASIFAEAKQRPPNVLFVVADDLGKYYFVDTNTTKIDFTYSTA